MESCRHTAKRFSLVLLALAPLVGCSHSPRAIVSFQRRLEPSHPLVSSPNEKLQIGIIPVLKVPPGVTNVEQGVPQPGSPTLRQRAATQDSVNQERQFRQKHKVDGSYQEQIHGLSERLADAIQALMTREIDTQGLAIGIVDRRNVSHTQREKALIQAGLVKPDPDADYGPDLSISTWVFVDIEAEKHVLVGTGQALAPESLAGLARAHLPRTKAFRTIGRSITVRGTVTLSRLNAQAEYTYRLDETDWDEKKTNALWGSDRTEQDLSAQSKVISDIITKTARQFVGALLGADLDPVDETIKSSSNEYCKSGVLKLAANDWQEALADFEQAIREESSDDRAHFGAGLACEKMGRFEDACKHYSQAYSIDDEEDYYRSRERVKQKQ